MQCEDRWLRRSKAKYEGMTDSEEVERSKCEKGKVQNENVDGRRKW